ncbi:MAG: hypothetical protein ABSH52_18035 [Terriglobia bacterium]|jgi:hypothetical protein
MSPRPVANETRCRGRHAVPAGGYGHVKAAEEGKLRPPPRYRLHSLVQAMLAVNDMFVMAQPRLASFFFEDVRAFLDRQDAGGAYVATLLVAM